LPQWLGSRFEAIGAVQQANCSIRQKGKLVFSILAEARSLQNDVRHDFCDFRRRCSCSSRRYAGTARTSLRPMLCDCCAIALRLLCDCFAIAVRLLCGCFAIAVRLLCYCCAIALRLLCDCCAVALRLLCGCFVIALRLLCDCFAITLRLLCDYFAVAL
jgi:hypothetical protein